MVGKMVNLNGSGSSSPPGGGPLSYHWTFLSRPQNSGVSLTNPASPTPSFTADAPGSYTLQLTVTNTAGTSQAAVTISTQNTLPVANAGPNQSVAVGSTVQLDGSGSTDADGDGLSYAWTMLNRPAGSVSAISGNTGVRPTFVADRPGRYLVQLIVNDGKAGSASATVTISTLNTPPVANAGLPQTVTTGATVHLSGANSTDVDGDLLSYVWNINSKPEGSAAVLSNPASVAPTFLADRPGTYIVQLIVDDGLAKSPASTVSISTSAVLAPSANAGANQTVKHGTTVTLTGNGSDPQSMPLTYLWSLTVKPAGSTAALNTPSAISCAFLADRPGIYVAQLIVNNGYLSSLPATVTIATTNTPPVANPGASQGGVVGSMVTLDGSGSTDADGDALTYSWSHVSKPAGSAATLVAAGSLSPSFVPDLAGSYVVQLIVNDGVTASAPATSTITVVPRGTVTLAANSEISLGQIVFLPVSLSTAAPAGGITITLVSSDPARIAVSPQSVFIPQNATVPATQPQLTAIALGPAMITASAPGYTVAQIQPRGTATAALTPALLTLHEGETKNIALTLTGPAPPGGMTFAISWSTAGVLTAPQTVTIPQGTSSTHVAVSAVKSGSSVLRATAPELAETTATITVQSPDILLPPGIVVPPGELVTFPVSLAKPAPQATFVALTSSDPSKVALSVAYLLFNQGQTQPTAQPKVHGITAGPATITATATGFSTASATVQTGYSLFFSPATITIRGAGTETIAVTLNGPPPAGGLAVTLSSSNPAVATVPASVLAVAGSNTINVAVTGVGTGSAIIRASAPGTGEGTANITVTDAGSGSLILPPIQTLQLGQTVPFPISLSQPAPAGGTTITVSSTESGIASIQPAVLLIPAGQTHPPVPAQLTAAGLGQAVITASAPGYSPVTRGVQVTSIPAQLIVFSGTPQVASTGSNFPAPLVVAVRDGSGNSVPGVAVTFQAPSSGASGSFENGQNVVITNVSGFATSATFVANGTPGSYSVTANVAGVATPAVFLLTNIALAPGEDGISLTGATVGRDLQAPVTVRLSRPAPAGGLRVTVETTNPAAVLLSGRVADAGQAQLTFTIGEGLNEVTGVYVQALQGTGSAVITANAPGWKPGVATIALAPSGIVMTGPGTSKQEFTVGQGSSATLTVTAARLDDSLHIVEPQQVRGDYTVDVALATSSTTLGVLAPNPVTLIGGETSRSAIFTAGLETSGSATLTAGVPSGFSLPASGAATVTATVIPASFVAAAVTVGENLQASSTIRLTSPAPNGGLPLTIVSNDPDRLLFSATPSGAGSGSLSLIIPAGRNTSQEFYLHALAGTGQATYDVTGAGAATATGTVTFSRSGFVIGGPFGVGANFFTTVGAAGSPISVMPMRLDGSLKPVEPQPIRGGLTVTITATSANITVGTLSGLPLQISGGMLSVFADFLPGSSGDTMLALTPPTGFVAPSDGIALIATVKVPGMVLSDGLTIGENLQATGTVLIGTTAPPGGLTLTLTSHSPLLALSQSPTGKGQTTAEVTIPAGSSSVSFYLQGTASSGEATYTASAPGFAAKTATVRLAPSGFVIAGPFGFGFQMLAKLGAGPQAATLMTAALDPVTNAFLGTQPLAGGQTMTVSLSNTNTVIGTIPSTVTINGGMESTPVAFTPVSPGTTQISIVQPPGTTSFPFTSLSVTVWE
jgi:hypothetical protein